MEAAFCATFAIATLQLYRDKHRFEFFPKHGATHCIFRKVVWFNSLVEIVANIDFLGVFGE